MSFPTSSLPGREKFYAWKGATFRSRITVYESDSTTDARDLTDYTAELIIRDEPEGTILLSLTTENGGITLGGVDGTLDLFIDAVDTQDIDWKVGVYDLTITGGDDDDTDALLFGNFVVEGI